MDIQIHGIDHIADLPIFTNQVAEKVQTVVVLFNERQVEKQGDWPGPPGHVGAQDGPAVFIKHANLDSQLVLL